MAEPIRRQALGQQMQQVRRERPSGQTVDTSYRSQSIEVGADRGSQIVSTLINAAGQGLQIAGQKFQERIEDDKVRQMNNALMGLQPSDDATQAGYVAHGVVGVQNQVLRETKRLEQLAATFEGSDEDWEEELVASRKKLQEESFENYPALSDPKQRQKFLGIITNSLLEQSPRVTTARIAGKLEQERTRRLSTFQENLLQKMDDDVPDSEVSTVLNTLINENREALQLSQGEAEQVLIQAAVDAANRGDSRLIDFTKQYGGEVSLYDKTGKLQQAEKVAGRVFAAENAGAVAIAKDELNNEFNSGNLTWPQFASAAEELNARTGNTAYSTDQLVSLKNSRQRAIASNVDVRGYIEQGNLASTEGGQPVGISVQDSKTKQLIVDAKSEEFDLISQSILEKNPDLAEDPEAIRQLNNRSNAMLSEWISSNQLVNEGWVEQFDTILNYNLENVDADTAIPTNLGDVLDLWHTLPAGSRLDHANSKVHAMLTNYEDFKAQGKTDIQALALAQKAVRSTKTFTGDDLKQVRSAATSAAGKLTKGSWIPFDRAPGWYRDMMAERLESATINNMKAGYTDVKRAAADAATAFERHHTTLRNGQLIFGDRSSVAAQMKVHPEDIEITLDAYLESNSEELLDRSGGAELDELYYDFVPGRGIAYIRSGINGMPVSPPIVLSELKVGRDEYLEQKEARRVESLRKRMSGAMTVPDAAETARIEQMANASLEARQPAIDGWSGATRLEGQAPTEPAMKQEREEAFEGALKGALMEAENSIRAGYDEQLGVWTPHTSLEGGNDTIGYGHKLTDRELRKGYIEIDGSTYRFTDGDSEITENVATKILRHDMKKAEESLKSSWSEYDELPDKYQKVLINLQFNTGSATPSNWPNLRKAMKSGDDAAVRREMVTSFRKGDDKQILEERARLIADAIGLQ